MAPAGSAFPSIRSEGGLLPPDLLGRLAAGQADGLSPGSYHLVAGERLRERITRSWNRLQPAWLNFRQAVSRLPDAQSSTTATRERWLLVLFEELGFGRLQVARGLEAKGTSFPVSHVRDSLPIHLVGAGVPLDRRTPGQIGAARTSPHGLVQEFLNASDDHLWGIVSNGLELRLLRDSSTLTRQTYLEFDLEEMMEGSLFSDFSLLWLVLHESRFEGEPLTDCWLERWSRQAQQAGVRALDQLRKGVEEAIGALGSGLLAHPANGALRDQLYSGELTNQDYYRQLLRLIYRLIFLFVAEDREVLLRPDGETPAGAIYRDHYSLGRLRRLVERRRGATPHPDLWRSLKVVMDALGSDEGCPALGLPGLGSWLWSASAVAALGACELSNRHLLRAVEALAFTTQGSLRRVIDYRNLGSEELGSVYESLLERHPEVRADTASFRLSTVSGNERKTTGSYYTPSSLIGSLIDSAVGPVLDDAAKSRDPEAAILGIRVVDPACGSGHFLIAAAHRIARALATARTGEIEPAPEAMRSALRDVIGHCLFGVDANPMAVELCKVSLWLEAMAPGRPLSFLDHRILCGNSLLGATPELLADGIPDGAFKAIGNDDKAITTSLRRQNKREREGQGSFLFQASAEQPGQPLAEELRRLDALPDDSVSAVHEKERRYGELTASPEATRDRLAADAWCAAFFVPKRADAPAITQEIVQRFAADGEVPGEAHQAVEALARDHRFFHWHIAFAQVFKERAGFDVVLGNPPWEQMQLAEQEFFALRVPDIASASGSERKRLIAVLESGDPSLYGEYREAVDRSARLAQFVHDSQRFPLCGRGKVNTYSVFAELMRSLVAPTGRAGVIVPSGIATDDTTKGFFAKLVETGGLASLYDFENHDKLFPIDSRVKFCLLTLAGSEKPVREAEFMFFAHRVEDLADEERHFRLTAADFRLFNPNTKTCPIFRTKRDAEIARGIYERVPVLIDRTRPDGNPWNVSFRQGLFNMTSDSHLFRTRAQLEAEGWELRRNRFHRGDETYLPLYEGKMFHHFDHRFATFEDSQRTRYSTSLEKVDPHWSVLPRYWVSANEVADRLAGDDSSSLIVWRDITNTTNERTVVSTPLPRTALGHKAPFIRGLSAPTAAVFNSVAFDFIARCKLGGTSLTYFVVEQLPLLTPAVFAVSPLWEPCLSLYAWLVPRIAELCCTGFEMLPLAIDLGFPHAPFRWDDTRRQLLRAELDAAFFCLYSLCREDVDYVIETFSGLKHNDHKAFDEYRTKRLILERYDALAQASVSGVSYQTVLDPPPAHPSLGLGPRREFADS